jgi:hypothetical protein
MFELVIYFCSRLYKLFEDLLGITVSEYMVGFVVGGVEVLTV